MGDLISKHDVLNAPLKLVHDGIKWIPVYYVEELPYIKRRTGKWIKTEDTNILECSCCHIRWNIYYVCDFDYCPCCGARMEGEME